MIADALVIRRIEPGDASRFGDFLERIAADAETARFFFPHALDRTFAERLCATAAGLRDRYFVGLFRERILVYWMLRGWDEGYEVPSFGVCVDPAARGAGLGQVSLAHAIGEARAAGASRLRVRLSKRNPRIIHMHRKFGFDLTDGGREGAEDLIGILDLGAAPPVAARPPSLLRIASLV